VKTVRKHLIDYAKTKDVFAAYKASGYNREFYEAHRDTLALRSAEDCAGNPERGRAEKRAAASDFFL